MLIKDSKEDFLVIGHNIQPFEDLYKLYKNVSVALFYGILHIKVKLCNPKNVKLSDHDTGDSIELHTS